MAAGLSLAAMADNQLSFYTLIRAFMIAFGSIIACHTAISDAPLWMAGTFALLTVIFLPFFDPPKPVWLVLNPLVSLVYLTHAAWLGLRAMGWA